MKLSIVIPALNEEDAIGAIIERCLAARATIIEHSPVDAVEVIVVSDGSTDRTAEIAAGYDEVHLIVFEKQNRSSVSHFLSLGSVKKNVLPLPTMDSTHMLPPHPSTIFFTTASPMPVDSTWSRGANVWNI